TSAPLFGDERTPRLGVQAPGPTVARAATLLFYLFVHCNILLQCTMTCPILGLSERTTGDASALSRSQTQRTKPHDRSHLQGQAVASGAAVRNAEIRDPQVRHVVDGSPRGVPRVRREERRADQGRLRQDEGDRRAGD